MCIYHFFLLMNDDVAELFFFEFDDSYFSRFVVDVFMMTNN